MTTRPDIFTNATKLKKIIDTYFKHTKGEYHLETKPGKADAQSSNIKVWDREPEPSTMAGLALYLGFNSLQEFDEYETTGAFANALKRGRLRIEAEYEKKLHNQPSTGVIFALKSMGWGEKSESKSTIGLITGNLTVQIIDNGPKLAGSEQEVEL